MREHIALEILIRIQMENRLVVAKRKREEVGWTVSLGLLDPTIAFGMNKQ